MISESIQQLGLFHYPTKQHSVAKEVLRSLALLWLDDDWGSGEQVLHDRSFLKKICDQYGKSLLDISNLLTDKLKSSVSVLLFLAPPKFSDIFRWKHVGKRREGSIGFRQHCDGLPFKDSDIAGGPPPSFPTSFRHAPSSIWESFTGPKSSISHRRSQTEPPFWDAPGGQYPTLM